MNPARTPRDANAATARARAGTPVTAPPSPACPLSPPVKEGSPA